MRLLDIAFKDLRQIARERQSAFFLLIMPVVFTLLFGYAFGGFTGGATEEDLRLPLALRNEDEGPVSPHLLALLQQSGVIRVLQSTDTSQTLARAVSDGELAAALVVPATYSDRALSGTTLPLTLIVDAATPAGFTVQGEAEAAATRLAGALQIARISTETAADHTPFVDGAARQAYSDEALSRAVAAWEAPPVQVRARAQSGGDAAADDSSDDVYGDNAFAHASPGMMAQFVMAGLITASQVLVLERKNGALRRLLTTTLSRRAILMGHYVAMFIMIVAQLLILIIFGQLALGLPYFRHPVATLMLVVASALFGASLGLLIGALAKSEEQAVVFSLVPMFILAGMGGAWMPLEFTSPAFQRIAAFTPVAWMVDGFKDIIVRGLGLQAVLLAGGVLLLYAVLLWILAAWRFRFE
jgi:ABC-2 type transport system permease protein